MTPVQEVFCRTFQVTTSCFGVEQQHDLIENGGAVAVTNDNAAQYVDLYVKWLLEDSVKDLVDKFKKVLTPLIAS